MPNPTITRIDNNEEEYLVMTLLKQDKNGSPYPSLCFFKIIKDPDEADEVGEGKISEWPHFRIDDAELFLDSNS